MCSSLESAWSLCVVGVHWMVAGPGEVVLLVLALAPAHGGHGHDEDSGGHHAGAHGGDQRHSLHRLVMGRPLAPHSALIENVTRNNLLCQNYIKKSDKDDL